MANYKQYLDNTGLSTLVDEIKKADAATLQSAKDYSDSLAGNYDAAGAAGTAETNAKAYTDSKVGELADGQVKTNTEALAKLNGDANTDGSVAKAVADSKALVDADIDGLKARVGQNETDIAAINNAETGILAQAKADATTKANAVQSAVDALDEKVGDLPEGTTATDVIGYIDLKTANIASDETVSALDGRVSAAEQAIDAIEADYLTSESKTELEGKISTAQAAADAAQDYAEGVASDLADEVKAREDADTALDGRVQTIETKILTLEGAMHFIGVKDAVPEDVSGYVNGDVIIVGNKEYVFNGTAFVEFGDATVNAEAITALTGRVSTNEGDITTLKGNVTDINTALGGKVAQSDYDAKVAELEEADDDFESRISTLEGAVGESGSVAEDIATAKSEAVSEATAAAAEDATTKANQALTDAKKYADEEDAKIEARVEALEVDTHTHSNLALLETYTQTEENLADAVAKKHEHTNKEVLDGITADKVSAWDNSEKNAKDYADGLNTTMTSKVDAIDSRLTTAEGAVATKAEASALTALTERVTTAEANISSNTSAINSFAAIDTATIQAMFA